MPWTLEIHHIYLRRPGDATLIIARHPAVGAHPPIARAVLIDGGDKGGGGYVNAYINAFAPAINLDAIVVTHFDKDHFYGITELLQRPVTPRYHNAIVYDCGRLPNLRLFDTYTDQHNVPNVRASKYSVYRNAIAARGMLHATADVNSFDIARYDANHFPTVPNVAGSEPPTWLLGKDVLWGNGLPAWAENPPAHAPLHPTLRCVVANKWVRQVAGLPRFISTVDIFNGPNRMSNAQIAAYESAKTQDNAKSLGFLLEFNGFRYYVAGDLFRQQEDGLNTIRAVPMQFNPGVGAFLNQNGNAAGRVLAMKTSHHGAVTSSSREFLTRLRPSAAVVSCGYNNSYGHPHPEVVNSLDGYPELPIGRDALNRHPTVPPKPPLPPILHYLTGYLTMAHTRAGDAGRTAGPPGASIRLTVTEAQSQRDCRGQVFRGVRAAADRVSTVTNLGLTAAQLDAIADAAVMRGVIAATAVAVGAGPATATAVGNAVESAGNRGGGGVPGLVSVAVAAAAAAPGAGAQAAAIAAVAAAGPGWAAAIGLGAAQVIGAAVVPGATAASITAAAQGAGPAVSVPGATAAGFAGFALRANLASASGAGFAAVAGLAAGLVGANAAQGTALGAAVGGLNGQAAAPALARLTTRAALAAGMAPGTAALAGAVAGAGSLGGPDQVRAATNAALNAIGDPGVPAAGNAAAVAATLAANDLFTVAFQAAAPVTIAHTD
ncbi:hypothetical protein [Actinophytocola oryzae]|uniref:Beta-lactamase superfamily II metal-dependent hydrolase n=1 Tax=Actinophytocola oryzae TaxID=502181 RepID=A0A4R7W1R6_9PSEU|nr:hypothetical protein [Actinophytocola oryzae]TDV55948.1 hypothetical protein CLV71_1029 [Actinophytocola oryzae]